jgi:HCOMODA/2-hydroxy-3-carboxy-muconic semialdehyde decarboxylase
MTDEQRQAAVRVAARAVVRAGFSTAYGHCSARIDEKSFLVCAPRPMGLIKPGEPGRAVPIDGPLPEGVLGEVRIHREIYKRRPDVGGVVRAMPPNAMTLSVFGKTPKPRHGPGAYFAPQPPLWDSPMLVRDDNDAVKLAELMGDGRAIVMRGNGVVTAGESIQHAVVFMSYLEEASRIELEAIRLGMADSGPLLTPEQAQRRAVGTGGIYERLWEYLTAGDPESAPFA